MKYFTKLGSLAALTLAICSPMALASDGAWVRVKVIDGSNDAKWQEQNTSKAYRYTPSYGRGSYSVKTTYIGKTDTYYKPPQVNGESLEVQARWTTPPETIQAKDSVALGFTLAVTQNTQSAFKFSGSTSAWLGNTRLATSQGKNNFEVSFNNQYAAQSGTVTTTLGHGSAGQQKTIELNFYSANTLSTKYVYEWKSASTGAPMPSTLHNNHIEGQMTHEMTARLRQALAKGDLNACHREGQNMANYRQTAQGRAVIDADLALVVQRISQIRQVYDYFREIQELKSRQAAKEAHQLINAIAVKFAQDAVTEIGLTLITGPLPQTGRIISEMGKQASDFLGNHKDAYQLSDRARTLRQLDKMATSADEQMASLRPAMDEATRVRETLTRCRDEFDAASQR